MKLEGCWCFCPQNWLQMPLDVLMCPSRQVSPDSTEYALVYECRDPRAQEVEFHTFDWHGEQELSSNMKTCPVGYSLAG